MTESDKLADVIAHELGWHNSDMRRNRPYSGRPHTITGMRGSEEIKGITFRDLRDCYIRAIFLSTGGQRISGINTRPFYEEALKGEAGVLAENDLYGWSHDELDPMAVVQNLCCEIEKIMGIFPNVPDLVESNHD